MVPTVKSEFPLLTLRAIIENDRIRRRHQFRLAIVSPIWRGTVVWAPVPANPRYTFFVTRIGHLT